MTRTITMDDSSRATRTMAAAAVVAIMTMMIVKVVVTRGMTAGEATNTTTQQQWEQIENERARKLTNWRVQRRDEWVHRRKVSVW